ncbi:membrane-associating domain-containing protein [Lipomyces orientalis]|uniref:Membrane-associating domain-containing protein n=1 Tax=Lipomyces orientalis TaxID=1233043 RepID=A0ACC3TFH8_9ASCO
MHPVTCRWSQSCFWCIYLSPPQPMSKPRHPISSVLASRQNTKDILKQNSMPVLKFTSEIWLRIVQAVLSLLVLALSANTLTWAYGGAPAYLLFVSIWTFLALAYIVFVPIYAAKLVVWKYAIFAVEILTNFFWFTGFIAEAAVVGPIYCSIYFRQNACNTGKAAIAIAAITWCAFIATSTLMGIDIFGRPGSGRKRDVERGVESAES